MPSLAADTLPPPHVAYRALGVALAYWPDRWSPHTVAAVLGFDADTMATLTAPEWVRILDLTEATLAPIAASIAPAHSARRLRLGDRLQ